MKTILFPYNIYKLIFRKLNPDISYTGEVLLTAEISQFQIKLRSFISTQNVSNHNDKISSTIESSFCFYFLLFSIILTLLSFNISFAQVDSTEILNDKIFQYLEDVTEDKDDSQIYELFDELISKPIDINNAALDDILALPFIPAITAKKILRFIKKVNGIKFFDELRQIKNIDLDILLLLKPFVKITPMEPKAAGTKLGNSLKIRSRFISDIQNKKGFSTGQYIGGKLKSYQRIKGSYNNFKLGGLIEKDAGEKYYTDFYSGFLQYNSTGMIENFISGDYVLEFGQGLAVWSPYAFSKGSDATNSIIKRGRNFIPYSSSDENNFFRGGASTMDFGLVKLSAFYSQNNIDATLNDDLSISNLYIAGYHRTGNEISKKDNIESKSYGASIELGLSDIFDISFLHYRTKFDKPFRHKDNFRLSGDNFSFTSAAYNFYLDNISASGEFSYNGISVASVNNLYFNFSKDVAFATSVRSYPRNYFNLYSNGFGEKNSTQNELGFYAGVKWKTNFGIFNVYYDLFKQPYSSFVSILPSNGNDFLLDYKYKINKNIQINFKYKQESKEVIFELIDINAAAVKQTKDNYRFDLIYKLSKNIYGRNRVEYVNYGLTNNNEQGILSFQDIKLLFDNYNFIGRIIFFDTDSYNSRIYEFENNHRGLLTNLPMYGNGFRWYFIFNISPLPQFKISARYSETYKSNIKSFSSGLSEIKGNLDNRFSLQVDFAL